ncbi:hypothetical protein [Flavobacterium noncentrifugens]|uniref:Lipoprotein n=1 Tax=Flavobacterium noncentrifugens TaxID=1128970 RepID=A0A1G8SJF6_9FLAO|nr:hypothetical protein [Flavobacterium noncentrifugens]SDJ29369.1 hypothetical protein SAMN04487935_0585 [Flavobacterium noncentrifugens]
MKKTIIFLLTASLFLGCKKDQKSGVAFYYWKTTFKLSGLEKQVLLDNHSDKLYVRYFDIALEPKTKHPYPVGAIHFIEKPQLQIIPVVYIKNEVMLQKGLDIQNLVKKTIGFIAQINSKNNITIDEIQIDCDWTLGSRENYLQFVDLFKKNCGTKLSATIRLHQVKYFEKTKIPNVDRGILMYYNMGRIAPDSLNSIYDPDIAARYLASLEKYPLPLDVALPIYSWAIQIRDYKTIGLKSKIAISDLQNNPNDVHLNSRYFKVVQSHYSSGIFYRKGDLLKIEQIKPEDLKNMADELKKSLKTIPSEIIFYDLDACNTKQYEKGFFEQVARRF